MPEAPTLPSSAEIFDRAVESADKFNQLRAIPEQRRGDTYDADVRKARNEVLDFDAQLTMLQHIEKYQADKAAWDYAVANPPSEARGPSAGMLDLEGEYRTPGQQYIEGRGDRLRLDEGEEIHVRNLLTGTTSGTSGSNVFVPVTSPLYKPATNQQRRLFARDLLSVQSTGLASVPYIQELNASTNETGATAVFEASAKTEITMQFQSLDAPMRKIAAWIQATMEAIEDSPTLAGYIDTRLAYMLMVREEAQIIGVGAGGGNAPNIKGILDFTTQIQTATGELYDGVASAFGKIENVDGSPDGVVVNPLDYWAAVADRHAQFYDGAVNGGLGGAPYGEPPQSIWGVPAVRSRSVASGTALAGSWQLGATLFEREGPTIRTTDSHASLFISNTWVILAEERVGLAVHRPDWFVKITVTAPT